MKPILFYTQPGCPPCVFARQYFDDLKIPYQLIDIQKNPHAKQELMDKYHSYSTPTFVIGETTVIGFDQEKIMQLLNNPSQ